MFVHMKPILCRIIFKNVLAPLNMKIEELL